MFNKLKMKASEPLTHGWLWKIGAFDIAAVGIIYGGLWARGRYLEKKFNEDDATTMDYDKFEED